MKYCIECLQPDTRPNIKFSTNFIAISKTIGHFVNLYDHNISILTDKYEHIERIKILLDASVEKRLLSDRPIGCFLSGGLDSTIIASILCSKLKTKLKTFSIGLADSPDLKYAEIVSQYLNTDHTEIVVTEYELQKEVEGTIKQIESYDVTTVRASVPMMILSRWIKNNTR